MRVRKLWLLLTALVFLLFCCRAAAAESGTALTVRTPEALPKAGETFTVEVELTGNPGVSAIQFILAYDEDSMTCTDVSAGPLLEGFLAASNPSAEGGAALAAASASAQTEDGVVGVFAFTADADVTGWDFLLTDVAVSGEDGEDIPIAGTDPAEPDPEPPEDPGEETDPGQPTGGGGGASVTETEDPGEEADPEEEADPGEQPSAPFPDTAGHWSEPYVAKAVELGLFTGFRDGTFRPDDKVTRAQFVTVLYRMAGEPKGASPAPFADVKDGQWYADAVAWAYGKGYVNGTSAAAFTPNGTLTRQAAMKILFLYSGGRSGGETLYTRVYDGHYTDSGEIADWGKAGLYWGVYNTLLSGTGDATLSPNGTATRGQLAKILVGYSEQFGQNGEG